MKNNLLVLTREIDKREFAENLTALDLPDLHVGIPENEEDISDVIGQCNIILGIPAMVEQHINKAKNLSWVQSTFAGVDALISDDSRKDYRLTNVKDTYGNIMAEYVFAYLLMFHKRIPENRNNQIKKIWDSIPYAPLSDSSICILGTGSIGKDIARIAKSFGMRTFGLNTDGREIDYFDHTLTLSNAKPFLEQSDYVVNILPASSHTRNLIDSNFISQMKNDAVLINAGRGDTVCEDSLVTALREKKLKAAVLDVFKQEPLPEDSELWEIENLFITPHVSGYIISRNIFNIFRENYLRFIKGENLQYEVDFTKGY